jgi:signal transduction histidine kinase
MSRTAGWRLVVPVAAVALIGAAGSLAVATTMGMDAGELAHLVALLAPAIAATLVAALGARWVLMRATVRLRFVGVALVGAVVAIANLAALARAMFVSEHDATLVMVLVLYSTGAGVAAALVLARGTDQAVARLDATARRLGGGDLEARVGPLDAGEELDRLADTLDAMAEGLTVARTRQLEADRMRRDLITMVSHDLRTPLASLRAMVEAIDDGVVSDPPTLRRYASEMRRSVKQLADLVDDLFELTQLDAGAIAAETTRARLGDVVTGAVEAVRSEAETKRLALVEHIDDAADATCSPRITRVLQNLLTNAVRHTPDDGTVTIAAEHRDGVLALAVEDTGEGIPPEALERVFEPFYRGDRARSGTGAGLGLALARRIVEALGGRITVESSPAIGSRFLIELPS